VVPQPRAELPEAAELAHAIVGITSDRGADDVLLLDIRQLSIVADYFVICSADTDRQVQAIVRAVVEELERRGVAALHVEGLHDSPGWVLLDYGDVIVHVFRTAEREYYRLDRVWADAPTVLRVQ
jgi:ribosome-associated protein